MVGRAGNQHEQKKKCFDSQIAIFVFVFFLHFKITMYSKLKYCMLCKSSGSTTLPSGACSCVHVWFKLHSQVRSESFWMSVDLREVWEEVLTQDKENWLFQILLPLRQLTSWCQNKQISTWGMLSPECLSPTGISLATLKVHKTWNIRNDLFGFISNTFIRFLYLKKYR